MIKLNQLKINNKTSLDKNNRLNKIKINLLIGKAILETGSNINMLKTKCANKIWSKIKKAKTNSSMKYL